MSEGEWSTLFRSFNFLAHLYDSHSNASRRIQTLVIIIIQQRRLVELHRADHVASAGRYPQ